MDHRASFFDPFASTSPSVFTFKTPSIFSSIQATESAIESQDYELAEIAKPDGEEADEVVDEVVENEVENNFSINDITISTPSTEFQAERELAAPLDSYYYAISQQEIPLSQTTEQHRLTIKGQGTISIKADTKKFFQIVLKTKNPAEPNLYLEVTPTDCTLKKVDSGIIVGPNTRVDENIPVVLPKGNLAFLPDALRPSQLLNHWLSVDRYNGKIRYGRGYCSAAMTLLEAKFKHKDEKGLMVYDDPKWQWLDHLEFVEASQLSDSGLKLEVTVNAAPLVRDLPPYIVTDDVLTLSDLENGFSTVIANLPTECQQLYRNVAGPNIVLDDRDFPQFSEAIRRSVSTEGLLGYKLFKRKEKDGNFKGTYLRITIGSNIGNSPGIPYVLEIWPAGHQSPVHDHGDCFAIIKVLHGNIMAYYYDSVDSEEPLQIGNPASLIKGDVTWLSADCYQVHQLRNESISGEVCCTIQCYQYATHDTKHYEYFKYHHGKSEEPGKFDPNSDMSFGEFKEMIKQEWLAAGGHVGHK